MLDMRCKSMKPIRNELVEVQTLNSHFGLRDMPGNSDISLKPKLEEMINFNIKEYIPGGVRRRELCY